MNILNISSKKINMKIYSSTIIQLLTFHLSIVLRKNRFNNINTILYPNIINKLPNFDWYSAIQLIRSLINNYNCSGIRIIFLGIASANLKVKCSTNISRIQPYLYSKLGFTSKNVWYKNRKESINPCFFSCQNSLYLITQAL